MAVPFDAEALEPRGDPVAVLGGVVQALAERGTGDVTGAGQFSVSPTGALAYASDRDQSGRFEVYVQRYPEPAERVTVSTGGGNNPVWHPNGRELFFLGPEDAAGVRYMMSARLQPGSVLAFDAPERLFPYRDRDLRLASNPFTGYEVTADGDHFITTKSVPVPSTGPVTRIHLVQNWLQEVKAGVAK